MNERYVVSYMFGDGDSRLVDRIYQSLEDAETVLKANRINSPKLQHFIYKLVPIENGARA